MNLLVSESPYVVFGLAQFIRMLMRGAIIEG